MMSRCRNGNDDQSFMGGQSPDVYNTSRLANCIPRAMGLVFVFLLARLLPLILGFQKMGYPQYPELKASLAYGVAQH